MPFDLSVTISMHFYERGQTKRDVRNFRFEKGDSSSQVRLIVPWGDLYFHAYVGSGYFLGFKILNFNIWGGGGSEYFPLSGHYDVALFE